MEWPWRGGSYLRGSALDGAPGRARFGYTCHNEPSWPMVNVEGDFEAVTGRAVAPFLEGTASYGELIHPEDQLGVWTEVQAALREARAFRLLYRVMHADGGWRFVYEEGGLAPGDGAVLLVTGVISDITGEQHLLERFEQQLRLESIGRVAGRLASELNNVLTVVHGTASLLAAGERLPRERLLGLKRTAEVGAALTRRVHDLADERPHAPRAFPLDAWLADAEPFLARAFGDPARFRVELGCAGAGVFLDPRALDQAVLHLLANAAAATRAGGVCSLATRTVPDHHGWVEIALSDTGVGLTPEVEARAFEPFFSTRTHQGAAGLGLPIVAAIAARAGGSASLARGVDGGAVARLRFPSVSPSQHQG